MMINGQRLLFGCIPLLSKCDWILRLARFISGVGSQIRAPVRSEQSVRAGAKEKHVKACQHGVRYPKCSCSSSSSSRSRRSRSSRSSSSSSSRLRCFNRTLPAHVPIISNYLFSFRG